LRYEQLSRWFGELLARPAPSAAAGRGGEGLCVLDPGISNKAADAIFVTRARLGARLTVALLLLLSLFVPAAASAQNRCTLTSAQVPSLQVVRGSTNNLVIDTTNAATLSAMIAACGDDNIKNFEIEDITASPEVYPNKPVSVTLSTASTYVFASAGVGGGRFLNYTPSATAPSTDILSRATGATHTSSNLGTLAGRTFHFYQPLSALGVYFSAQVTIVAPNAPTASVSLNPASIFAGGTSIVTVTLTNPNSTATISGVADTITLPSGVAIAASPGASTTCGGTVTATAGSGSAALSGGSLAPGANCTITFNITSSTVASHTIPSGTPSATGANAGAAGTTATLTVNTAPNPPTIAAAFGTATIGAGGNTTLTLTVTNPNGSTSLTGVAVAAAALPVNLTGSGAATNCSGGTATYVGGTRELSLSGATLAGSASCTVTLTVTSGTAASYSYTTGAVSATGPTALAGGTATTGTLTVIAAPTIATSFSPTSVAINTISTLTLTLTNPNGATALTGVAVAGASLPAGLTGSGAATSCGGTASFSAGSLSMSGGSLAGGGSCTVTLSVQSSAPGTFNYTSGAPSASGPVSVTGVGATAPTALTVTQAAPTITSLAPSSGTTLGGTSVTITGTGFTNVTGVTFGGTPATAFTVTPSTIISATAPAHVAGTVDVVVTTAGGTNANTASDNYTYVAPPAAPAVTNPTPSQRTNNNTLVYSGTASASLQVDVYVDSTLMGSTTSAAGGAWSLTQTPALADGSHAVYAIAISSGIPSPQSTTINFIVDTVAPAAPTVTAPVSGSTTNDNTPTFTGTAEANSTVRVFIDSSFAGNASLTGTNWTYTATTLADGAHNFWATATDVAGNLSPQSTTGTLTVDTAAPAAPVITVPAEGANTGATPTISGTAEANATVNVTIGATTVSTTADGAGAWSLVWTTLAAGPRSVTATARDAAFNTSAPSAARNFTVVNAPVATSFTYGSIVPYNIGGDPPTTFSVTGSVTNSPTSYAVGSATTAGGGSVSIDNAGLVSFTPAVGRRGNDSFTFTATNAGGTSAPATVTVAVGNPTFAFTLAGSGTRGAPLSGVQIGATGGKAPYSCGTSVATGALPAGTSLNNDCTITGTPTASGSFTFKVTAVDSSTGTGPFTQTSPNLTLVVAVPTLTITTNAPTGAAVGAAYSQTNPASGGDTPYTYALASGSVPPGTTLNTATGTVSGTLTTVGTFSYTVKVTDNQGTPATATGTLVSVTVAKGNQTIAFISTAPAAASVGGATYTPTATATSGLTVSFAIDAGSSAVCSISGGVVSFQSAGACVINANQPGDSNWNAAPQAQQSFAVGQGAQTIAFISAAPPAAVVGGATYTPAATATSGLTVSFTIDAASSGVCTISGGVVSFTGVGNCTVNANQPGNASWSAAPQVQQGFAVGKGSQTITFAPLADTSLSASPLTLSASVNSPLTVSFSSTTSLVCTVSGTSLTLLTTGTCTINADQAGDANWNAAAQVQRSFTVTPAALVVTPGAATGAAVGASFSQANPAAGGTAPYTYVLASGTLPAGTTLNNATGTVSGTPTTAGAFSYAIRATDSQGAPATATGATVSGTIAKGSQTINFAPLGNASLSASPLTLSATTSASLTVTFASVTPLVCSVSGTSLTLFTTGTCTINADQAGDANWNAAAQVQRSFTVTPATLVLTPGAPSGTTVGASYSQANPASGGTTPYAYSLSSGALPAGTTLDAATGTVSGTPTTAGPFSYAVQVTDSQALPVIAVGATVSGTIAKGSQAISFAPLADQPLSASPLTLSATTTSPLAVTFSTATPLVCTASGTSLTLLGGGTCTVNADQIGDANWNAAAQVQRSFTVTVAPSITSIAPASGPEAGGTLVTITGTGFTPASTVSFGAASPAVTFDSVTQLRVTAPPGTGTVNVSVTTVGGTSAAQSFSYIPVPAVTSLSVSLGPTAGGNVVVLTGSNFGGATSVRFGAAAASFTVDSATRITAVAPAGTGSVNVSVTTLGGTSAAGAGNAYSYVSAPTISGLSPAVGPTAGGTAVTITGTGLSAATSVTVDGIPVAIGSNSATSITIATPPHPAGAVAIIVTTAGGSASATFTYLDGPAVTGLSPANGPTAGGTNVTIAGTGLANPTAVRFGATPALSFTAGSATSLTAVAPPGTGQVNVTVTTAGGTSAAGAGSSFAYVPDAPVLTAPADGARLATARPAITGTGTAGATVGVRIDGAEAGTAVVAGGGAWTFTPAGPLGEGAHSVDARQVLAGQPSAYSAARSFTVDTAAPAAPVIRAPVDGAVLTNATPLVSGTAEPAATVTLFVDGAAAGTVTADGAGAWSFTTATLADGAHNVRARATDAVGNASPDSASVAFTIDRTAPAAPVILVPAAGATIGTTSPVISGTAEAGATVTLFIDGASAGTTSAGAGGAWSFTSAALAGGPHSAFARAVDGAGNASANSATVNFTIALAPVAGDRSGIAVPYETATAIDLNGVVAGNVTSLAVATAPAHGSATVAGRIVTYTPAAGYFGPDSFTYTATGPGGTSAPGRVSLTVAAPAPPTAQDTDAVLRLGGTSGESGTVVLTPLVSGVVTNVVLGTAPLHGSVTISGNPTAGFTALYTRTAFYVGADSFTFRAVGPGGTSAPATVRLQIVSVAPTAPPVQVSVLAGRPVSVDLTSAATGGPFTAARLVSLSPADAGDAALVESGPAGDRRYRLEFTSRGTFAGAAIVTYTLSNASATSLPLTVTISVTARPDPSADAEVRGLEGAQTGAVRRFAQTQMANFGRRLEQLHGDGGGSGIALQLTPGIPMAGNYGRGYEEPGFDPTQADRGTFREEAGNAALRNNGAFGRAGAVGGFGSGRGSLGYDATGDGNSLPRTESATRGRGRPAASADDSPASAAEGGPRTVGSVAAWANGAIIVGRRDETNGRDEFSISTSGISGGVDVKIAEGATFGIGLGAGRDRTDVGDNGSGLRASHWAAAVYGSVRPVEGAFIDAMVGIGGVRFDLTRFVTATGTDVLSRREGDMQFGALTAGIDRQSNRVRWSAYGGIEAARAQLDAYVEAGPPDFSLAFDDRSLSSLSGLIGARAAFDLRWGRALLTPRGRFEYRHEFEQADGQRVRYANWLTGPSFLVDSDGWSSERFTLSFGIGAALRNAWRFGVDVDGDISGSQRTIGLRLEVAKEF
jgi:hypothetical protein